MTDDIVARLRDGKNWLNGGACCGDVDDAECCAAPACIFGEALKQFHEAADEIERLRGEVERLTLERDYWARARNEWEKSARLLEEENKRLTREMADFHMDYRIKCDVETKAALALAEAAERETERLKRLLSNRLLHKEPLPDAYPDLAKVEDWLNGRGYTGEAGACHAAMGKIEHLAARAEVAEDRADAAEAKVAKLREALTPFAEICDAHDIPEGERGEIETFADCADLRRARAVLQEIEE